MNNKSHVSYDNTKLKIKRVWRSIRMWGVHRTFAKLCNRISLPIPPVFSFVKRKKDTLLVGCGQFGASTASFFIAKDQGNRFLGCYDIDDDAALRASKAYGYEHVCTDYTEMLNLENAKYAFIASNHASHTPQAVAALERGLTVHVEKPISVNWQQLAALKTIVDKNQDRFFVGYNRPFSEAFYQLRSYLPQGNGPFTIDCFVAGHAIDPAHWYYNPSEGTRICGNVGHWIDMSIHLLALRGLPNKLTVSLSFSDPKMREENLAITLTSDLGDLISMVFTTRGEPFDGVNESINIQHGDLMAKIYDFRRMDVWKRDQFRRYTYYPKDVGHRASVNQMYQNAGTFRRAWSEVFNSTTLMLHITDMVREGKTNEEFSFSQAAAKVQSLQKEDYS